MRGSAARGARAAAGLCPTRLQFAPRRRLRQRRCFSSWGVSLRGCRMAVVFPASQTTSVVPNPHLRDPGQRHLLLGVWNQPGGDTQSSELLRVRNSGLSPGNFSSRVAAASWSCYSPTATPVLVIIGPGSLEWSFIYLNVRGGKEPFLKVP